MKNPSCLFQLLYGSFCILCLNLPAAQAEEQQGYVDRLIDPAKAEDDYTDILSEMDRNSSGGQVSHSLRAISYYLDSNSASRSSLDLGLSYAASLSTANYGRFQLNLTALNEHESRYSSAVTADERQTGIRRFTLSQTGLAISDTMSMDNVAGVHRLRRYQPFRDRPNLINYRFSAAEPDIFGLSSTLYTDQFSLLLSAGSLGESSGSVLPGFTDREGDVQRVQYRQALRNHAVQTDVWRTSGLSQTDSREGGRVSYDGIIGEHTVASANLASSGGQLALLAGASTQRDLSRHDYGAYYFEPDFIWVDTRIGDDSTGAFYRVTRQYSGYSLGGSFEFRRDGLQTESVRQQDTSFLSLNAASRLSRDSHLSAVYSFRHVQSRNDNSQNESEHSIRSYYTYRHGGNQQSSTGIWARSRPASRQLGASYALAHQFQNDGQAEFRISYQQQNGLGPSSELSLNADWSTPLFDSGFLSAGLGYTFNDSPLHGARGFSSHLNYEQTIGNNLGLSLQLDYSSQQSELEQDDFSDTLFTASEFDEDELSGLKELSVLLSLHYQLGQERSATVLAADGRHSGSGSIRGFVFLDQNGDGLRQASERGVQGITVFLNSVHPVVSNARGEFQFPHVGLGEHFVFVDESTLPLPWTLRNGEYSPAKVSLRRNTQVDIPIAPYTMAETDH